MIRKLVYGAIGFLSCVALIAELVQGRAWRDR